MKRAPNRLLMVCVVVTALPRPSAAVRCVVSAPSSAASAPVQRLEIDAGAPLVGVGLGGDALDRHLDESGIAAGFGAIGEGDLQDLGQQMDGVHRAEAESGHVVAFEDVQHLRDVHARGGGRRRTDDLPAAIAAANRRALDHVVAGKVLARDKAAGLLHAFDEKVAERAVVQRRLALLGDQGQRLGIVALDEARAGF